MQKLPSFNSRSMNSPSTRFVPSARMGIYEPIHQIGMWGENFKGNDNPHTPASVIVEMDHKIENQVQFLELSLVIRKYLYDFGDNKICYFEFLV